MSYMENIYICLAAPLLMAVLCLRGNVRRTFLFLLSGMTACLLSAFVSSFLAGITGTELKDAVYEIVPAVEEFIKFSPVLFYILVFLPEKRHAISGALVVAVGFATLENVCFLTEQGTSELLRLMLRGFGTGAMHVVCGMIVATGLYFLWDQTWLRLLGTFALLCLAITFHAIFNIFAVQTGIVFWVGSSIPLVLILTGWLLLRKRISITE